MPTVRFEGGSLHGQTRAQLEGDIHYVAVPPRAARAVDDFSDPPDLPRTSYHRELYSYERTERHPSDHTRDVLVYYCRDPAPGYRQAAEEQRGTVDWNGINRSVAPPDLYSWRQQLRDAFVDESTIWREMRRALRETEQEYRNARNARDAVRKALEEGGIEKERIRTDTNRQDCHKVLVKYHLDGKEMYSVVAVITRAATVWTKSWAYLAPQGSVVAKIDHPPIFVQNDSSGQTPEPFGTIGMLVGR